MKIAPFLGALLLCTRVLAQEGPFDPAAWPPTIDPDASVHYVSVGDSIPPPGNTANWTPTLQILAGGDQDTTALSIGGFEARRASTTYLNIADTEYTAWAEEPVIDILMQVYGDAAVMGVTGEPRNYNFLIGSLPQIAAPVGGQIPLEAKNFRWNWVLFRIDNGERADGSGRRVGTLSPDSTGANTYGGVNGGTIRLENVPALTVRAVAFGPQGAFGEPEAINRFEPPVQCDPEPVTNYVFLDFNSGQSEHLQLLSGGDQITTVEQGIGPEGNKRTAARAEGVYMNFGVTENYLGAPCNDPHPVKMCLEYYDDPALAGTVFGPEAYASDATGAPAFVPGSQRQTLEGTGQWVRRSWTIGGVNLHGINTVPLTGTVRLHFAAPVFISRVDIAVLREGLHPLAGTDPLSDCPRDPAVCTGEYGDYAEMDLHAGIFEGLSAGTSGGDQEMIQEEAGPPEDRRMAIRPAREDGTPGADHGYLNFAITDNRFGPSSQPNARLAVCVTFFDDAGLTGQSFRPEVYRTELPNGTTNFAFLPASQGVTLQGSNKWVDAYFEIPNVKFEGVNQGPQAAARFFATGKIFITRLRYAIIRECGATEGVNHLENQKPPLLVTREQDAVRLQWVAGQNWNVQYSDAFAAGGWEAVGEAPTTEEFQNILVLPSNEPPQRFYRLVK